MRRTLVSSTALWPPAFALALLGSALFSTVEASTPPLRTAAGPIRAAVEPFVEAGDFMGVVAVGRDGEPPLLLPFGSASVELGTPHQPDGIFMIGSVSKQFTAAAILLLEEAGKLATDDPVARHLPEFPHGDRVTIEQLLTHTSGVADIYSLPSFGATGGLSGDFDRVIAELGSMPLTFEPGESHLYSNGGYALLAAIVESASGSSYGDYLERRIFAPLGMASTAHDAPGPAVPGRVPGYDPWGERELLPVPALAPAFSAGSGSLWSSGRDLLTWTKALHGGQVLSPASYAKFTGNHGQGYGYGISLFKRFGRRVAGHDGRVAGYSSDLARYVDDKVTVAVLGNVQSVARDTIRSAVAAAVLDEPFDPAERPELVGDASRPVAELEGVYAFGPAFEVTVAERDGRLMARANQGGWSELVLTADGEWFSRMLYATVRFGVDTEGRTDRLIWGRGEGAPVGTRVR